MTFRIRRSDGPEGALFALSGEMDAEHAWRLEDLLDGEPHGAILLDLGEVTLVARDAIRFLARAEARGVRIVNCPVYVRSWIVAEHSARGGRPV